MLEHLQTAGIFILFLGPLVFFHELGHFLFARFAGVKVEVFSIGFGPKIFSKKIGDTLYALSIIPLGGYVKMFGDDPLSETELTDEEKAVAYTHKTKIQRFLIVFGGPLANFIFAFVIYFSLITVGENVPETRFGVLPENSTLYKAGIRTGDVLTKINSQEITSFDDLNLVDSNISQIEVKRSGSLKSIPLQRNGIEFIKEFSAYNNLFRAPIFYNAKGEQFILKEAGQASKESTQRSYEEYAGSRSSKFQLIPVLYTATKNKVRFQLADYKLIKGEGELFSLQEGEKLPDAIRRVGYYPSDLYISTISMNSAASEAKLISGDLLHSINGVELKSFVVLRAVVKEIESGESVELVVINSTGKRTLNLTPKMTEINGELVPLIGIGSNIKMTPIKMILIKTNGLAKIFSRAWTRTIDATYKTALSFKKLVTGEMSLKNVGGPIAIGQVASDSFNISFSMFFRLMALISINLGVINLFPIPVLDGGHIVFILFEAINRGPLSRKKMQYAQQVGMSLLFLLIFVALFNDISRFF
jgi:regulator of sigma E protease